MKSFVAMCMAAAAFSACAAVDDLVLTFSSAGPDTYADGTRVLDGECYVLVWLPDGSEGVSLAANGEVADPSQGEVVLAAPVAKDGKCPTVVFEIDSARAERYASGTWCVYLLDTRRYAEDGAVSLAGVSSDGAAKSVNAVGKIAGVSVKVSDVAHAPETAVASKAVSAATASALPKDVPQPKIKGIRVEGGFVYVTVANTVPYLQYNLDAGATPAQLDEARAANNPVNGQADGDIILVSPVKVGGSFFRVNRN